MHFQWFGFIPACLFGYLKEILFYSWELKLQTPPQSVLLSQINYIFLVRKIEEVNVTGGEAGASSSWDALNLIPINAFIIHSISNRTFWHNGLDARGIFPATIWYDFISQSFIPAEISFQPRGSREAQYALIQTPTSYQFIGTNDDPCDDQSEWSILCEDLSGRETRNVFDTRYCTVKHHDDHYSQKTYRCLGIRMLRNDDPHGSISLGNIRIWKKLAQVW